MNGVEKIGSVFYFPLCNFYACRVWKAKYPRTSTPRMMRYTPNTAKLCLRTYSISPLMTSRLTTKETTQPTARLAHSAPVAETPESRNFTSFSTLAPSIVGMARKKENSAPAALPRAGAGGPSAPTRRAQQKSASRGRPCRHTGCCGCRSARETRTSRRRK